MISMQKLLATELTKSQIVFMNLVKTAQSSVTYRRSESTKFGVKMW